MFTTIVLRSRSHARILALLGALGTLPAGCRQSLDEGTGDPVASQASALTSPSDFLLRTATGCADVFGGSTADGTAIIQWYCNAASNQRLRATGTANTHEVPEVDDVLSLVVAKSDKCIAVAGASRADGAAIVQQTCSGGDEQRFTVIAASGRYRLMARHSGLCLSVPDTRWGRGWVQTPCDSASSFDFTSLMRTPVVTLGKPGGVGLCLAIASGSTSPGAPAVFAACNGSTSQQFANWPVAGLNMDWAPQGATMLASERSGKCLGVRSAALTAGAVIEQQLCSGGDHQVWERLRGDNSAEIFRARHSGLCLQSDDSDNAIQGPCPAPSGPTMAVGRLSPAIDRIEGIGTQSLTLTGSAFSKTGAVTIGGQRCTAQSWSNNAVTCTTPSNADGLLVLGNALGYAAALDAPVVTSLSPAEVTTAGQPIITLRGKRFDYAPRVQVGSQDCSIVAATPTEIRCLLPYLPNGDYAVQVQNRGYPALLASRLTVMAAPRIDSASPSGLTRDQLRLTLTGQGFGSAPSVTFAGSPCTVLSSSDTQVVGQCAAPISSSADVIVKNGSLSSAALSVLVAPWLDALTPDRALTAVTTLTLTGQRFGSTPQVVVGGNVCPVISAYESQITCLLTATANGSYDLVVNRGSQSSNSLPFIIALP